MKNLDVLYSYYPRQKSRVEANSGAPILVGRLVKQVSHYAITEGSPQFISNDEITS